MTIATELIRAANCRAEPTVGLMLNAHALPENDDSEPAVGHALLGKRSVSHKAERQ
jgi:hypothetical protein